MKIAKGDVVEAKDFVSNSDNKGIDLEDSDGSHVSNSTLFSGSQSDIPEQTQHKIWTSVQYIEAKSVLKEFLVNNSKSCKYCEAKNPKISKPTFGSFHMDMSVADAEKNCIKGYQLGVIRYDEELQGGEEDNTSEAINIKNRSEDDVADTAGTNSLSTTSSKRRNVK